MSSIDLNSFDTDIRKVVRAVLQIFRGASSSVGVVTLTPNATTTVVTKSVHPAAVNISADQQVFLSPRSANAAAAVTKVFVASTGQGTFTLTHDSNAAIDRTFGFHGVG